MKTQTVFSSLLSGAVMLSLLACAPPNRKLEPAPESPSAYVQNTRLKAEVTSKVDILFVIDNSRSMLEEQAILQNNINGFVKELESMDVDYHIGIVSVNDRNRIHPGSVNYWPNGKLRPLKVPGAPGVSIAHKDCTTTDEIARTDSNTPGGFVTRETPNGLEVLRASLNVGVLCLEDGGPEAEELFSPALAAVSKKMAQPKMNQDFYRSDAHLAVIIVSDATPSKADKSSKDFVNELGALKGFNPKLLSLHVIGVTAADVANSRAGATCRVDYGVESAGGSMEQVVAEATGRSNGTFLRLCSTDWGQKLTNITAEIKRRILGKVVALDHAFKYIEAGSLKVKVNGVVVAAGENTWHREDNNIVFSDQMDLGANNDANIEITYTTLTDSNARRAAAQ